MKTLIYVALFIGVISFGGSIVSAANGINHLENAHAKSIDNFYAKNNVHVKF